MFFVSCSQSLKKWREQITLEVTHVIKTPSAVQIPIISSYHILFPPLHSRCTKCKSFLSVTCKESGLFSPNYWIATFYIFCCHLILSIVKVHLFKLLSKFTLFFLLYFLLFLWKENRIYASKSKSLLLLASISHFAIWRQL